MIFDVSELAKQTNNVYKWENRYGSKYWGYGLKPSSNYALKMFCL